jgi:virginiamycin B lyase
VERETRRWYGCAPYLFVAAALGLGLPTSVVAQTITEYTIPTATGDPKGIAPGPDGALWFVEYFGQKIGRVTTIDGSVTEFAIPTAVSYPTGITAGPDGALWFTETFGNKIGRITTGGVITEFPLPSQLPAPGAITLGPDGNLWFTELNTSSIGRITPGGVVTEFPVMSFGTPTAITAGPDANLWFALGAAIGRITTAGTITLFPLAHTNITVEGITAGPDGALWFTESGQNFVNGGANSIGRITTAGAIAEFPIPTANDIPGAITTGPDGALWFTCAGNADIFPLGNSIDQIGRITTGGAVTEFPTPTPGSLVQGITSGPDGNLWFTEGAGQIGRIVPTSLPPSSLVAATLPQSRSISVGGTATAFATIINSGSAAAQTCGITPVTSRPVVFHYQTTDPSTNQVTGTSDTPVTIASGASQSFVVGLTASAAFAGTEMVFAFGCAGSLPAPVYPAVNTLLLTASTTPEPDVVALAATPSGDGILTLNGSSGANAFAVASVNLGATGVVTVAPSINSSAALILTVCQTTAQGQCMAAPTSTLNTTIAANATPTFSVFVFGEGLAVPFVPQANRVLLIFSTAAAPNVTLGETSVAVRTQ